MKNPSIYIALVAASILAEPAFAQAPPTTAPAPAPTVTAPAVIPGAPVAPLTTGDEHFVVAQLEGNMAEIQAGQLALKNSRESRGPPVRRKDDHGSFLRAENAR